MQAPSSQRFFRTASSLVSLTILSSSSLSFQPPLPSFSNPKPSYHLSPPLMKSISSTALTHLVSLPSKFSHSAASVLIPVSANPDGVCESESPPTLMVVSFYKFAHFPDPAQLRRPLKDLCQELRVSGGIILAPEGINGSICGTRESVESVLEFIESDDRLRFKKGGGTCESRGRSYSPRTEQDIHHVHSKSSPLSADSDSWNARGIT